MMLIFVMRCLAFFFLSLVFFLFCLSFSIYFKAKYMFIPNTGLVIRYSTESCFQHIPRLENAFCIYFGVIPFHLLLFGIAFQSNFTLEGILTKWFQKMGDNFDEINNLL